ncbi:MAG: DUF1648 domain-containing protein [Lachnospiraceae bacterium]|nr:DUF1648 domain-containing protein [Lachnospiraceae bacterium]
MIKRNKWQLIISSVIILLPIVAGLFIWNYMPEQIATHWGINGEANGWSRRSFTVFVIPLIMLAIHWSCIIFTARDPKNKDQSSKVFNMVLWILPITSLIVSGFNYAIALENDINIGMIERVLLGLMFVILGNYMPKCRQNSTIGVKVTWALRNEKNWNKTHRFTGKLWVFGGLLLLATLLIPVENSMYVLLPLILCMAFAPMIYSYIYYRKQLKAGTATKEDAVQTSYEKKVTRISVVVVIIILVISAISLFAGKFEVKFNETSFTIEAVCWDDAIINYADIDNIEWREQNVKGNRTFGYGTPFIVMGECENAEFGKYTGYTYTSCDACVVLYIDDKILIINGKNEEDTKVIYDELVMRMNK